MPEEDYDYDFIEYSQEDLESIDAIAAAYFEPPEVRPEPEGLVQIHEFTPSTTSPMQQYRRGRELSVSDLISPLWCEVQFDYGLRQARSRPLETRPDSFVSASGKQISVSKEVAVSNDVTKEKGRAVHKKLEVESGLKQVQVRATSREERWALRMLNFITGIEAILVHGYTRELPVFGIVHGQILVGVIDEVKCRIYSRNTADLVGFPADNTSQIRIDDCFINQEKSRDKKITYILQLLDTKTRRTDSIPFHEDTLPSQLQLMLYYRLLSDLVSESSPFDFSSLWNKLHLDSSQLFSAQFLVDADLVTNYQQERTACLDDLVRLLRRIVKKLDLIGVNQHLQLVYCLQPIGMKKKRKSDQNGVIPSSVFTEERDLSLAIEASLKDLVAQTNGEGSHQNSAPEDVAQDVAQPIVDPESHGNTTPLSTDESVTSSDQDTSNHRADNENGKKDKTERLKIIGSKEFYYDEDFLNGQVSDILDWWHGKRKPNGVPVHLSRRCFSCEYSKDCEWREEKAMEFTRSLAQRKTSPERGL